MKKDSGRNVFNEITQHVNVVKDLVGPVYQSKDMSHGYSEIVKQAEKLSVLNGPVYLDENNRNSFNIILKTAESLKSLAALSTPLRPQNTPSRNL